MRKIVIAVLMMSLFAGVSMASVFWGSVTTSTIAPRSYQIEIAKGGYVLWRTTEHISDDYASSELAAGDYSITCTIYDDHGIALDRQVRTPTLAAGVFQECSFAFTSYSALSSSTWGSIKATIQ